MLFTAFVSCITTSKFAPYQECATAFSSPPTLLLSHRQQKLSRLQLADERELLRFSAHVDATSCRFPTQSRDDIHRYFESDCFLESLFGDQIKLTSELRQQWKDVCEHDYHDDECLPDENEATILIKESVVQFPGLQLHNTVTNGISKRIKEQDDFPVYLGVLLSEKIHVSGSAPAVWCFNKLTGATKVEGDSEGDSEGGSSSKTKATSRISVVEKDGGYALHLDCKVSVFLDFPKFLCRILPTTRERMEKIGSASLQKAVVNDIMQAVNSTSISFSKWYEAETVNAV